MTDPRSGLLARFRAALAAADPYQAVRSRLAPVDGALHCAGRTWPMRGRVVAIGAGKASARMAEAVEAALGGRADGVVVVKDGHTAPLRRIRQLESSHPVPDRRGADAALAIESAVAGLGADDLVLFVLSGGASALLPAPRPSLTLEDKRAVTDLLLASGADIHAVNTVRKHLSRLKGGRLAALCHPAAVLTLAVSDVPGDDPASIGSGPTVADPADDAAALAILERVCPPGRIPPAVRAVLSGGAAWTPKPGDPRLARAHLEIVVSSRLAVAAAAGADGVLAGPLDGEAADAAERFCAQAAALPPGAILVAGGETTVTLGERPGRGGRNQEFALAAARWIDRNRAGLAVLAAGTDGTDGPTDAAGGLVDAGTWARARAAGLDPAAHLARHDAYPLLEATGDLLRTGPIGTNVMDLAIAMRTGP